jgi:hypothetical protein
VFDNIKDVAGRKRTVRIDGNGNVWKKWFKTVLEDQGIKLLIPNPLHRSFWQETD